MQRIQPSKGKPVRLDELRLGPGEVAALLGPSGCGKTTLLLGLLGLLPGVVCEGQVEYRGEAFEAGHPRAFQKLLRGPIALVLQDAAAALDPVQTVLTQLRQASGENAAACLLALSTLGVEDAARVGASYPHQISGGQAQRVLLALAFLRRPSLLIADEPSASLDGQSLEELVAGLQLLRERRGAAILLSTHDPLLVRSLGARVLEWRQGSFGAGQLRPAAWPRPGPASEGAEPMLRCRGLHKKLGGRQVLADLELELHGGEILAIVGPSGSGKSTLAQILAGHLQADSGQVRRLAPLQLLFQDAHASLTPQRRIQSLLAETKAADFDPAREAEAIGLPQAKLAATRERLSGGERRRVALLRALSVQPSVLILDEPTAYLDPASAEAVMQTLLELQQRRGLACVLITHDLELARAVGHRVLRLAEGRLEPT